MEAKEKTALPKARNGDIALEVLDNGQVVWARNAKGQAVCNSPKPKGRGRCKVSVGLFKNGRCEDHGGKALPGVENQNFKHGRYTRYRHALSGKLGEAYDRIAEQENYLTLEYDIRLTAARVEMTLTKYGELEEGNLFTLRELAERAGDILLGEYDETDLENLLQEFMDAVEAISVRNEKGKELERTQEHLRKLVDTEAKRINQEQDQLPAAKAWILFGMLRESVRAHGWALMKFLQEYHPEAFKDPRRPDMMRGIAGDIQSMQSTRAGRKTDEGDIIEAEVVPDTSGAIVRK
jgi:hypothetical protein